jgi:hypothetical protein
MRELHVTAIKEAFKKADKLPADERLYEIAKDILSQTASFESKQKSLLAAVCSDAALLWELFEPWRTDAARKLLNEVSAEERGQKKSANGAPGGSGHDRRDNHHALARSASISQMPVQTGGNGRGHELLGNPVLTAPSIPTNGERQPVAQPSGSGQYMVENQMDAARPAFGQFTNGGNASAKITRRIPEPGEGLRPVISGAKKCVLEWLIVNGKPIGDLTPREVTGWSARRKREGRFAELLIANLPWDKPIKLYRKPEEAEEIWAQASKEIQDAW